MWPPILYMINLLSNLIMLQIKFAISASCFIGSNKMVPLIKHIVFDMNFLLKIIPILLSLLKNLSKLLAKTSYIFPSILSLVTKRSYSFFSITLFA